MRVHARASSNLPLAIVATQLITIILGLLEPSIAQNRILLVTMQKGARLDFFITVAIYRCIL